MLSLPLYATFLFVMALPAALAENADLKRLMEMMEQDVLEFAENVAELYTSRCYFTMYDCNRKNYEHCLSTLPNPTCPTSDEYIIEECDGCGARFDYTVSTVHLSEKVERDFNDTPTDPKVIESICYSRELDQWFQDKHENNKIYWESFVAEPPQMFFGTRDGSFRIFPGRRMHSCYEYDPRERPWYIAASSGPKNIILILDTSKSMGGQKLYFLKEAAQRVVETLRVGDRVAIVKFDSNATSITDNGGMFIANKTNKDLLIDTIKNFTVGDGGTNFAAAFAAAFDVMDRTIEEEDLKCNSAILFLTDAEVRESESSELNESDLISQVTTSLEKIEDSTGNKVLLFTFSVSVDESQEDITFPRKLACSSEFGVWSKINDTDLIEESLESYYELFALGLGQGDNKGFVAWVDLYNFTTGGVLGTTVSAPVFDRSTVPPIFLGVVGFDLTLEAMKKAVGLEDGFRVVLDEAIFRSTAKCPSLNLTRCDMESFRSQGTAGNESLCYCSENDNNCTNCTENQFIKVEPETCSSVYDNLQLWNNTNGPKDYSDAVCCTVNETKTASQCRASGEPSNNPSGEPSNKSSGEASNNAALIGGVIGGIVGGTLCLLLLHSWWNRSRPVPNPERNPEVEQPNLGEPVDEQVDIPIAVPVDVHVAYVSEEFNA